VTNFIITKFKHKQLFVGLTYSVVSACFNYQEGAILIKLVEFHGTGCVMFVKGCNSTAVCVNSALDSVWSKLNLCNMIILTLTFSPQISVHYVFHCIKRNHMHSIYVVCTELNLLDTKFS